LMDETPIKAGRQLPGKMKQGYYWPLLGDKDEIAFPFAASRAEREAREVLGSYCGTLVTDGYSVYERVTAANDMLRHAQCWVHTRRQFLNAEHIEPDRVGRVLQAIASLYAVQAGAASLAVDKRLELREQQSKRI